jgi:Tol biopolymer transport system component
MNKNNAQILFTFTLLLAAFALAACIENRSQQFIFKRYDRELDSWSYYKTDLYDPTQIEALEITPCCLKDSCLNDNRVQPVWSPNGEYYVCGTAYDQLFSIYTVHGEKVTELPQGNPTDPTRWGILGWSPDSQYLSITKIASSGEPFNDFSIVRMDGSDFHQVYTHSAATFFFGDWSPNGKYVVLEVTPYKDAQSEFIFFEPEGEEIFRVALSDFIDETMNLAEYPTWAPDSKKIAFFSPCYAGGNSRLYVLDVESREIEDISPLSSICGLGITGWSSNSEKILFAAFDWNTHISGDRLDQIFYSVNADGSDLMQLTDKGYGSLYWTLDGEQIIVSGYGEEGIYLMDADGSNKELLVEDGSFVSWIK